MAIEQAVKIGEWFKRHAEDGDGGWVVNVRPATVKVIDDIVEDSSAEVDEGLLPQHALPDSGAEQQDRCQAQEEHDDVPKHGKSREVPLEEQNNACTENEQVFKATAAAAAARHQKDIKPKKRKRPAYDKADVPEARTRFIDAIEIAISLKA